MKKSISIIAVVGFILMLIGGALFYTLPIMTPLATFYHTDGITFAMLLETFRELFNFTNIALPKILILVGGGVGALIFLASIVVMFVKRRPAGLFASILFLLDLAMALVGFTFIIYATIYREPLINDGQLDWGWFGLCANEFLNEPGAKGYTIACFGIVGIFGVGFLFGLCSTFFDMVLGKAKAKKAKKAKKTAAESAPNALPLPSKDDDVIVVHDDEIIPPASEEDIAAALGVNVPSSPAAPIAGVEPEKATASPSAAVPPVYAPGQGIQGPLLVQYINTYSPGGQGETVNAVKGGKNGQVPLSEIQGAITGEKPLTAEEIRKIVREEMAPKEEEKQPVIISVPSPAKSEKPGLTAEDVRRIFSEELTKTLGNEEGDVVVEETPAPALTAEEIRAIIAEEIAASKKEEEPAPEPVAKVEEEPTPVLSESEIREAIGEEIRAFFAVKEKEEEPAPAPTPSITAMDIRQIINEEFARREPETPKSELTPDVIRDIIRQEMVSVAPLQEEKVAPVNVIVKAPEEEKPVAPEPVKEEPKKEEPAPAPTMNPTVTVVVKTEPAVTVKAEEPKKEEAPKARVVGAINPDLPPHEKIIRIPFQTRMKEAEKEMIDNYNELKSEIMSYGVKSRISNKGDTFRLHKVTFVKITIAGKSLKLYFALDPKDYANSPIPVQDAGHKGVYKDIPLVFKVKSELSVRRAKELIANVMEKNGLEQGKVENRDWAKEIPDAKETDSEE